MRDGRVTLVLSGKFDKDAIVEGRDGRMSLAAEMSEAAARWLASLDDAQRWRALFTAPSPADADQAPAERTTWFYTPTNHGGLPLGEQRHHLAGALGAALAGRLFELDWVRHAPPASRAVRLTDAGRAGLAATFGLSLDDACPAAS